MGEAGGWGGALHELKTALLPCHPRSTLRFCHSRLGIVTLLPPSCTLIVSFALPSWGIQLNCICVLHGLAMLHPACHVQLASTSRPAWQQQSSSCMPLRTLPSSLHLFAPPSHTPAPMPLNSFPLPSPPLGRRPSPDVCGASSASR